MADALPFGDDSFDAALAVLTIHHWSDLRRGLEEMARVARGRLVQLTWDPEFAGPCWLVEEYFPGFREIDQRIVPRFDEIATVWGEVEVIPVPVPHDCSDGFAHAYWRRPSAYLDADVRGAISTFSRIDAADDGLLRLARDLESGAWERRHSDLLELDALDLGYRLVVAR
jgi:SAM-dependent methyltransferase